MKKILSFLLVSLFFVSSVEAQVIRGRVGIASEPKIEPQIISEQYIKIGKKAIFDASQTKIENVEGTPEYIWDFGNKVKQVGVEVVQDFLQVGKYTVKLTVRVGDTEQSVSTDIFVYNKKALLILDKQESEELKKVELQAAENGMATKIISIVEKEGNFLTEDNLVQKIKESSDYIKDSDIIMFISDSPLVLQAFNKYWQGLDHTDQEIVKSKFYAVLTNTNFDLVSNIAYQTFKIVKPSHIFLTRNEALNPLLHLSNYNQVVEEIKSRGIEYKIIDERGERSKIFFLSYILTSFVTQGASSSTIYLILIIPFLTFFVALSRQVVGIGTFGVYTPVIITVSFFLLGIWLGLIAFFFAVFISYILKYILNKFELLYIPKVALNLGVICLSMLAVIWFSLRVGIEVSLPLAIFPVIVMSTLAEKFMAAQTEEGLMGAMWGVLGTLAVVIISYYIVGWQAFSNLVISWPEIILLPLLLTLLLGKFSGLRISEYLRFRSLFREHIEE